MTISNNYAPLRQLGNGVTTIFSDSWNALSSAWLVVYFEDAVTGVLTQQLAGFTSVVASGGWVVTFSVAPPASVYVVIGRAVDPTQIEPYRTSKGFQGEVIEAAFDKLTAIAQDQQDAIDRSVKFQLGSSAVGVIGGTPIDQAVLMFSGTTGLIIPGPTAGQIASASAAAATATAAAAAAVLAQQAAEAAANGMKWRPSVRAATTAVLPACTYANGTAGVGATLTGTANGALAAQDGVVLVLNDTLLVKDQAAQLQNGVYVLTQVGTAGTPFILTRRTDADTWAELVSQVVSVEEGATNADTLSPPFICTVNSGGTIGVTAITWIAFPFTVVNGSITKVKLASDALYDDVISTTAATYVVLTADDLVRIDASAAAKAVTMPSAASFTGRRIELTKSDSSFNIVTITGITTLNTQNESVWLESDGATWIVVRRYIPSVWVAFTPTASTGTGGLTNHAVTGFWRREGDSMRIKHQVLFSAASAAFNSLYLSVPGGLSIDTTKLLSVNTSPHQFVGYGNMIDVGVQNYLAVTCYQGSGLVQVMANNAGATYLTSSTALTNLIPFTYGAGDAIQSECLVPILGWNS